MGMLGAAFLQGAGQGMGALAGGMFRDVEREQEQAMWEKRSQLLAQIQRENAKNIRGDTFEFENNPSNVATMIGTATTKAEAAGKVSRSEKALDLTDPSLVAAQTAEEARKRAEKVLDVEATSEAARVEMKKNVADKPFIDAVKQFKIASDPETAAKIAQLMASTGTLNAETALRKQNLTDLIEVSKRAKDIRDIQAELSNTKDDKRRVELHQQLGDLTTGGRNPEKFLEAVNRAQDNARDALKLLVDPLATDSQKSAANAQLDAANALVRAAAKMGGIDLGGGGQAVDPYKAAMDANRAAAEKGDKTQGKVGMLSSTSEWVHDPASPAGKRRAKMDQERARSAADASNANNQNEVLRVNAEDKARTLLGSGDKRALYAFQGSPEFNAMSAGMKAQVAAALNSR